MLQNPIINDLFFFMFWYQYIPLDAPGLDQGLVSLMSFYSMEFYVFLSIPAMSVFFFSASTASDEHGGISLGVYMK